MENQVIALDPRISKQQISTSLPRRPACTISTREQSTSYDFNSYLPPYRSLINPSRGYDYRSHRYFDARSRGDSKLLSKYKSLIITPISNTTHRIRDAASDGFSIKSHRSKHSQCRPNLGILDLPQEVLIGVFQILRRTDLAGLVCSLYVCKDFYQVAKVALYEDPYITSGFRLGQFVQAINMSDDLALMVQRIDLSRIRVGVDLTEEEMVKFSSNIVFGSCGGQYDESLMQGGGRNIYAGWRDFKYRFDATYGNLAHRSLVSTSFVPSHFLPASFTRPPIYSPALSLSGRKGSVSTHQSYSSLSMYSRASSDSLGSLFSLYEGGRRSSGVPGSPAAVHANAEVAGGVDGAVGSEALGEPYGGVGAAAWGTTGELQKPGFFNSMGLFMRATFGGRKRTRRARKARKAQKRAQRGQKRAQRLGQKNYANHSFPVARPSRVSRCSLSLRRKLGLIPAGETSKNPLQSPFGTPHPLQSDSLKQFCFARDIPIGYILHILDQCKNLRSINLSGIAWTVDFQMDDFQYFDWELARGLVRSHDPTAGQYEYRSMLLESDIREEKRRRERELAPYRIDKPIFWSDTVREINFNDPGLHSLTIDAIWPFILQLKQLERVCLKNCVWLTKETVRDLVFDSCSRHTLRQIDCTDSGLARNSGWAKCWSADKLREYLNGEGAVGMD